MLQFGSASSLHTGRLGDAAGAFVFEEGKWDFCTAKELKLCWRVGEIPASSPWEQGWEGMNLLGLWGQFGSVELSCEGVTRRVRALAIRNLSTLHY